MASPKLTCLGAMRRTMPPRTFTTSDALLKAREVWRLWDQRCTRCAFSSAAAAAAPSASAGTTAIPAKALRGPGFPTPSPARFMSWSPGTVPDFDGDGVEAARGRPSFAVDVWGRGRAFAADASAGSVFGFVLLDSAPARLEVLEAGFACDLRPGMYFAAPGPVRVDGGSGVAVTAPGTRALFTLGGPIEDRGRLPYIDGCSDTLLLAPARRGDPCFNHLHFPAGVSQTQHTHPSGRAGVVVRGRGRCLYSETPGGRQRAVDLTPGTVFVIPSDCLHAFETGSSETLDVVAFHPDSDFGPTPQDHPMVNRTIVDGVSASLLPRIQTREDAL